MRSLHNFSLRVHLPFGPAVLLPATDPEKDPTAKFAFDANSQVISRFELLGQNKRSAFHVSRATNEPLDDAATTDEWIQSVEEQHRSALYVKLVSLTRQELNAADADAALTGQGDSEWNRYRKAQLAVTNSLQQAAETLLIKSGELNAELDRKRTERFEELEKKLRASIEEQRAAAELEFKSKSALLEQRERALGAREASFETKESHYVARQKQTEQIDQIKEWLRDWSLTKGTSKKRWPIATAYVVAMVVTGALTLYATWHSYALLKSVDEIVKLAWWQWVGIWAKTVFPLAAFATFMIYFIRWSGDWARQHSEEEFRNRTRLIDIGRSTWLLEAVRDAQARNSEIPSDLLKELSRNLFALHGGTDSEIHPQVISDVLMHGLSSLRVRAADGSEVEASRSKKS